MRGLRYLMVVPVLLLLASVTMGISNYKKAKEEMRHDLTRALRQFVMDESRQSLLLDTLPSLQSDRVLTLNDVESGFNERLSIIPLKDTSHVAVCLLRHDDQEAFREEALVSSDTLLWHSARQKMHHLWTVLDFRSSTFNQLLHLFLHGGPLRYDRHGHHALY